jgi:predicted TPR repeat methyltransferase
MAKAVELANKVSEGEKHLILFNQAMDHYSKADQQSPYTWFCMAEAHEKMGNKEEASKLYKKIAGWNTNGINLAVVRARAVKKAEI